MNNSREEIIKVMEASLIVYGVTEDIANKIRKAHYDPDFDIIHDSDGSTHNNYVWPNERHPLLVWHDREMKQLDKVVGQKPKYISLRTYIPKRISYAKRKFAFVRDTNLQLKKMMEIYQPIPVKYVSDLERHYLGVFYKATISKFLFGR